jgi:hypothetical protein
MAEASLEAKIAELKEKDARWAAKLEQQQSYFRIELSALHAKLASAVQGRDDALQEVVTLQKQVMGLQEDRDKDRLAWAGLENEWSAALGERETKLAAATAELERLRAERDSFQPSSPKASSVGTPVQHERMNSATDRNSASPFALQALRAQMLTLQADNRRLSALCAVLQRTAQHASEQAVAAGLRVLEGDGINIADIDTQSSARRRDSTAASPPTHLPPPRAKVGFGVGAPRMPQDHHQEQQQQQQLQHHAAQGATTTAAPGYARAGVASLPAAALHRLGSGAFGEGGASSSRSPRRSLAFSGATSAASHTPRASHSPLLAGQLQERRRSAGLRPMSMSLLETAAAAAAAGGHRGASREATDDATAAAAAAAAASPSPPGWEATFTGAQCAGEVGVVRLELVLVSASGVALSTTQASAPFLFLLAACRPPADVRVSKLNYSTCRWRVNYSTCRWRVNFSTCRWRG